MDIAAVAYRNFYGRPWSEATEQAKAELREIAADALQGGR